MAIGFWMDIIVQTYTCIVIFSFLAIDDSKYKILKMEQKYILLFTERSFY